MICPNCGTQYENSTFCPNCGAPAPEIVDVQTQYYEEIPNNQAYEPEQQYDQQPNGNYMPQQPYSDHNSEPKKSKLGIILAFVAVAIVAAIIGGFIGSAITKSSIAKNTTSSQPSNSVTTSSSSKSTSTGSSESVVLYDDNDIHISFTGVKKGEYSFDNGLNFLIENDSSKTIRVDTASFSIEGFTISAYLGAGPIGAGKKSNTTLSLSSSVLSDNGLDIDTLSDVEISFKIYLDAELYSSAITTDLIEIPIDN